MRWRKKADCRLIPANDALRLTGLEPAELLRRLNVQQLTRVDESGAREELFRVPLALLLDEADSSQ